MYCPVCGAEYVEGITQCPDDLVELVAALPDEAMAQGQPVPIVLSTPEVDLVVVPEEQVDPHFLTEDEVDPRALPDDAVLVFEGTVEADASQPSAEFLCSALEENEIAVFVTGEYGATSSGGEVNPAGAVRIFVNRADEARAREIIAEVVEGRPPLEEAPLSELDELDS